MTYTTHKTTNKPHIAIFTNMFTTYCHIYKHVYHMHIKHKIALTIELYT